MLREESLWIRKNFKYLVQHIVWFSSSATYVYKQPEIGSFVSHFHHIYRCPKFVILFNTINQSIYFILGASTSSHLVICTWTYIISNFFTIFIAEELDMCRGPSSLAYVCVHMCMFFARNIFAFLVNITLWKISAFKEEIKLKSWFEFL
jgi:hypothetical protein